MKATKYNLFCFIGAIISASAISILLAMQTSNILTAMFAVLLYFFYKNQKPDIEQQRKTVGTAVMVAAVWAFFMMLNSLESFDRYQDIGAIGKITVIGCVFFGFLIFFSYLIYFIYQQMSRVCITKSRDKKYPFYQVFLIAAIVILLCWLPHYLMNYPGIAISDSCDQIGQAITKGYSNHHPVVHTWMIQGIMTIGTQLFGTLNAAVALYCVIQMIILALIYAFVIATFYRYGVRNWICIATISFYALIPYNVMFSFNMWKDSLFSGFVLLFTILLWKITVEIREKQTKWSILDLILFILSGVIICLFRTNGFYAFLLLIPFLCFLCWKERKRFVFAAFAVFLITILVKGPIFQHFEVKSTDFIESLSIPAQQIARVISDELILTEEQTELLNQIVDINKIPETYKSYISDPVKNLVRSKGNQAYLMENKGEYLQVWLQLGIKYPFQYLRAYIDQTEGYWNPDVQYWVYADGVYDSQIDITEAPIISPETGQKLKWLLWANYEEIPLYGLLWSIGTAVWAVILLAGYCLLKGKRKELCIFVPIVALWGTLMIATPVYAEFRYFYAIFLCMPVFIAASLKEGRYEGN